MAESEMPHCHDNHAQCYVKNFTIDLCLCRSLNVPDLGIEARPSEEGVKRQEPVQRAKASLDFKVEQNHFDLLSKCHLDLRDLIRKSM